MPAPFDLLVLAALVAPALIVGGLWAPGRVVLGMEGIGYGR